MFRSRRGRAELVDLADGRDEPAPVAEQDEDEERDEQRDVGPGLLARRARRRSSRATRTRTRSGSGATAGPAACCGSPGTPGRSRIAMMIHIVTMRRRDARVEGDDRLARRHRAARVEVEHDVRRRELERPVDEADGEGALSPGWPPRGNGGTNRSARMSSDDDGDDDEPEVAQRPTTAGGLAGGGSLGLGGRRDLLARHARSTHRSAAGLPRSRRFPIGRSARQSSNRARNRVINR